MNFETNITIFDLFIFLGVFQGLLLAWFFIKNGSLKNRPNLYQGLVLLFLSATIFEELLNNTGYIVRVLLISDFSEPMNFTFGPLVYLYIRNCIQDKPGKREWLHFIPAIFWCLYLIFYWVQPDELKYNSYVKTKHPDWELLIVQSNIVEDPLYLRQYINQVTGIHMILYLMLAVRLVLIRAKELNQTLFKTDNERLITLRSFLTHFLIVMVVFYSTKLYFGMDSDIGGYFLASYISFMIFATSYSVLNRSEFFKQNQSFLSFPVVKYKKSSLDTIAKTEIEKQIKHKFEKEKYYANNLASLSDLSKQIRTSQHHVSQVLNEKMGKTFFEILASYRVQEAKRILLDKNESNITIEELAERVGYNSKSSFNNVFKKLTNQTPSEFRKTHTEN